MKLNHVFKVSVQSCANPEQWIERTTVRQSNECRDTPHQLAANIACHYMRPTESGVQVEYLGLQKDLGVRSPKDVATKPINEPITALNPFIVTIMRLPT